MVLKYKEAEKALHIIRNTGGNEVSETKYLGSKQSLFDWMKAQMSHFETYNQVSQFPRSSFFSFLFIYSKIPLYLNPRFNAPL